LGTGLGLASAFILNHQIPPTPTPPYYPFDSTFAIYTGTFLTFVISLIIYNKFYTQKQLLLIVEQEVADRTQKLQESLAIKKEFLDNVSHEIKTPIHNITNIVSILYDSWDNLNESKRKELVSTLKSCNQRILHLCSNLLDLSKFKKAKNSLIVEQHNVADIIEEAVAEYKHTNNSIKAKILPEIRNQIHCDAGKILQVLRNLIDNSVKHGKNSPIVVEAINYGKDSIKIIVSDNGPGIPEQEISKIFEPFEQSSVTKTRAGGTGLGLSICKLIIEMHSGSIWAKNNKSGGVSFYFIVPNGDKLK
jgi:two-component system sensor histidine kinase ChiS